MNKQGTLEAKVKDILTSGFAEVEISDGNPALDGTRHIARFNKDQKVHRGDVVEIEEVESRTVNEARIAYLAVPLCAVFGFIVSKNLATGERILSAAILGFMAFIVSWLMNRRARMLKRQEYRVVTVIEEDPNHI